MCVPYPGYTLINCIALKDKMHTNRDINVAYMLRFLPPLAKVFIHLTNLVSQILLRDTKDQNSHWHILNFKKIKANKNWNILDSQTQRIFIVYFVTMRRFCNHYYVLIIKMATFHNFTKILELNLFVYLCHSMGKFHVHNLKICKFL